MVSYTGGTEFYTKVTVLFGDSSAGATVTSGTWKFFQGAGANYSDNNDVSSAQTCNGLQFVYNSGGTISLTYRNGAGSFVNTSLTSSTLNQGTVYTIEIVANNKSSGTINYTYNGVSQSVAVQKFDLYINGTRIGDDLAQGALPAGTSVNAVTFTGISSTANAANLFVDNVSVYNAVPAVIGATAPTVTSSAATSVGSTTATLNGNVTSDGGSPITERGFVYNTSGGVAITDNKTTVSGTTGSYTLGLSSLAPNQQYFFKAYAINAIGTTLSSPELSFTTAAAAVPRILVTLPGEASPNAGGATAQTAGTAFNITLTATTDGATTDTSINGSKAVTFSGPTGSPTYPGTVTFSSGVGAANITLTKAEATTITAADTTDAISGTASSSLTVNPGAIGSYVVTASSPQIVGVPFNVTVTAKDANNNTVTTDSSTSVTMGSGSGNVSFGVNPKTLASGTFTVSATDSTAETTTITALDANSKAGTTGSIVVSPLPKYRSKTTGNWNAAGTWEVSTDNGSTWGDAVITPTSADGTITIRNGHTVTISAAVTVDQVTVQSGGILTLGAGFTVANGAGDDIVVENGGVFVLSVSSTVPTFNAGATVNINGGGTLRVSATGMTGNAAGVNLANFVYGDASILDYTVTSSFSASGVTFFPNANASTIPIFRVSGALGVNTPGGGSATVINGVFEVTSGNPMTWTGAGTKTFRNGIRGAGNVSQGSAGQFIISGATADLGGAGTLTLGTAGLQISSSSVTTLSSDKTLAGTGALTVAGTLDLNGKTLTAATAPVFNGTLVTEIDRNGGSPVAGKIVLSSGTLTYGGTLTVNNLGVALTGGEAFDLFDATSFSGAFTATSLPTLGAGLNWRTDTLASDGSIKVNRSPVAANLAMGAPVGGAASLLIIGGKNAPTDADADALTVSAVTQGANGTVTFTSTNVTYTSTSAASTDSFTYTVSDGAGGTATGTVTVTLTSGGGTFNQLAATPIEGGALRFTYLGIPGTNYLLEVTHSLSGEVTWSPLQTNAANGTGSIIFTNTPSLAPTNDFYRTRYVP